MKKLETNPPATLPSPDHPGHLLIFIRGPKIYTRVLLDLTDFETDGECLEAVRYLYRHTRGWAKFFFTVKEVHYAQVSLRPKNTLCKAFDLFCDSLEAMVPV
jgi:hypothetical protein